MQAGESCSERRQKTQLPAGVGKRLAQLKAEAEQRQRRERARAVMSKKLVAGGNRLGNGKWGAGVRKRGTASLFRATEAGIP